MRSCLVCERDLELLREPADFVRWQAVMCDPDFLDSAFATGLSKPNVEVGITIPKLRISVTDGAYCDSGVSGLQEHPEDFLRQFMTGCADTRGDSAFGTGFGDWDFFCCAECALSRFFDFAEESFFYRCGEPGVDVLEWNLEAVGEFGCFHALSPLRVKLLEDEGR